MAAMAKPVPFLPAINHFVVVMLENRSFDHMLGFLYSGSRATFLTSAGASTSKA